MQPGSISWTDPEAIAIELSEADRVVLLGWSRRRETSQALALQAHIVSLQLIIPLRDARTDTCKLAIF